MYFNDDYKKFIHSNIFIIMVMFMIKGEFYFACTYFIFIYVNYQNIYGDINTAGKKKKFYILFL